MNILLLGKNGQVGWELQRALSPLGVVTALGHDSPGPVQCPDLRADFSQPEQVAALVRAEASGSIDVWFNLADTDATLNPGDHTDHIYTSQAMQEARAALSTCINQALFVEYDTKNRPANVGGDNLVTKVATWGATNSGIADMDHANSFDNDHNPWLTRTYYRVLNGTGDCAL